MKTNSRRKYDSDFKRNAVKLCEDPNRTVPEVANNLGINGLTYSTVFRGKTTLPLTRHQDR